MCSQEELKQIDRTVSNQQQQRNSNGNSEKQTAEQFFIDALAIAGTRNTIAILVEVGFFYISKDHPINSPFGFRKSWPRKCLSRRPPRR
jgi:hypothetical protein